MTTIEAKFDINQEVYLLVSNDVHCMKVTRIFYDEQGLTYALSDVGKNSGYRTNTYESCICSSLEELKVWICNRIDQQKEKLEDI